MKLLSKLSLVNLICFVSFPAAADLVPNQFTPNANTGSETLAKYVLNLGAFLGYDLAPNPNDPAGEQIPSPPSQKLIDVSGMTLIQNYVFNTFLGAIPVDAVSTVLSQFMPSKGPDDKLINGFANATFKKQNYSSPPSSGAATVSVSNLIDQETYQQDPVSQAVLNILGTPDFSYCMSNDGDAWVSNCQYLYQNKVMSNVIGSPLPDWKKFISYDYNQKLIGQLNGNTLMAPLLYSDTLTGPPDNSLGEQNAAGLTAQNQIQQAANFIRYASGAVSPVSLPNHKDYETIYNVAVPPSSGDSNAPPTLPQMQAQAKLTNYFTRLRIYAAQSSVGLGNLYYLLSKRMPQDTADPNNPITSQSLSEFKMATWRLFKPGSSGTAGGGIMPGGPAMPGSTAGSTSIPNKQWIDQINAASSATVQKEIATLLAEINYQMYLDRQVQERILLTNTIMLIQNTSAAKPSANFAAGSPP